MRGLAGQRPVVQHAAHGGAAGAPAQDPARALPAAARRSTALDHPDFYDRDLRRLFSDDPQHASRPPAAAFMSRFRKEARRRVGRWTGTYQYTIDQVIGDMIRRSRELQAAAGASGGGDQAGVHHPADRTDHELPEQRPAPGGPVTAPERKKLRVLALVHPDLIPPEDAKRDDASPWKMEYDVVHTLRELEHEVMVVGVGDELGVIRNAVFDFKPHIAFNLVEGFDDVVTFDFNIVAYLELLKVKYTGCNSRGLMIGRDKSLSKKLLIVPPHPGSAFRHRGQGAAAEGEQEAGLPALREVAHPRRLHRHLPGLGGRGRREAAGADQVHPREGGHRRPGRAVHRRPRAVRRGDGEPPAGDHAHLGAAVHEDARGVAEDRHRAAEVEPQVPEEARHRERGGQGPAEGARKRTSATSASASTAR